MKKIVLLISFHLMTILAGFGQTQQGALMLGGSFGLYGQDYQETPSGNTLQNRDYSVEVKGGRFIRHNLALGLSLFHSASENKANYDHNGTQQYRDYHTQSFGAGPFIRKYVPLTEKFFFFGQGTTNISFGKTWYEPHPNSTDRELTIRNLGASASVSPGFTYFATSRIGLEFTFFHFLYNYTKHRSGVQMHNLHLGLDLTSLRYGFRFYFNR